MLWSFVQSMYKSHYNCVRQRAKPTSFIKLVLFKMVEENTKTASLEVFLIFLLSSST